MSNSNSVISDDTQLITSITTNVGDILIANTVVDPVSGLSDGSFVTLAAGDVGTILTSNGPGSAPTWESEGIVSILTTKGDIYGFDTDNARIPAGSNAQVLTADSTQDLGVKWATPTTGTVTSVALSAPAIFSVSGSPVSTTGTLTFTLATQSANKVFAGPTTGSAAAPTFRSLVAADMSLGSVYSYQTPSTSFTITIGAGVAYLVLNPAGTLASGTITMPASPGDGDVVHISTTQIITSLTISGNSGQTIADTITTLAVGGSVGFIYVTAQTKWFRVHN